MGVVSGSASRLSPWLPCTIAVASRMRLSITTAPDHRIANSGLDRGAGDPVRAGRDDGVDELAVGVLVAAVHELGDGEPPIGPLVVHAAKVERPARIVSRTDRLREPAGSQSPPGPRPSH